MPDRRRHRGPHPDDVRQFGPEFHDALRAATEDLSWLLTRNYSRDAALKLVGDRHGLTARQRLGVLRSACSDQSLAWRLTHRIPPEHIAGRALWIDGLNVLLTIETALGSGILLLGRDGCCRDMASVHGSYRKVAETAPAIEVLGDFLENLAPAECRILLDRPVSNSGRLRALLEEIAARHGWPWRVELHDSPDRELQTDAAVIASSDSAVLDRAGEHLNLAAGIIGNLNAADRVVRMASDS